MKITIELKGNLKKNSDKKIYKLDLKKDIRVNDLIERLRLEWSSISFVTINNKVCGLSELLHDNDKVKIFPPIGGG